MNSKFIMIICAAILGIIGVILIFLPKESEVYLNMGNSKAIVFQILGALYFGFAIINWTAKGNLTGGIFNRPIVIGNFTHFFIGSLILIKFTIVHTSQIVLILIMIAYLALAVTFGYLLFMHPGLEEKVVTKNNLS